MRLTVLILLLSLMSSATGHAAGAGAGRLRCCPPACGEPSLRACCAADGTQAPVRPAAPTILVAPVPASAAAVPNSVVMRQPPRSNSSPIASVPVLLLTGALLI